MRVLSIDGGGYLGLTTAAFIEAAERHFKKSAHASFDMFCGTSTGAIIALALAAGLSGEELRNMYEDFGPKVFNNWFPFQRHLRFAPGFFVSRYSNKALRRTLEDVFKGKTLGDLHASGKRAVITAFSLTTGRPRVFKTDHGPGLTRDNQRKLSDVALASASAPVYLPIVTLEDPQSHVTEAYCDGGVFANHPALLGFTEATYHCGAAAESVKVLSLSTPRADLAEYESSRWFYSWQMNRGLLGWGTKLASILIDGNSMITHEVLRRVAARAPGCLYERFSLPKPPGVEMDTADPAATRTLRQIGFDHAAQEGARVRLAPFFGN